MRLYKLNDTILKLQGNAAKLLNGLSSNALDKPFNAFLNLHGRIITTFRQQQISDDEFLIALPVNAVEALLKHLNLYAKLNQTKIEQTSLKVYVDIDTGQWLFVPEDHSSVVSEEEFTLFRLDKRIPLQGIDYQTDDFILNIDELTYISYTKGCFLGQEPVAKVHNRSKPTWVLKVRFEDECAPEEASKMSSKVVDPTTGRVKGFIFVKNT